MMYSPKLAWKAMQRCFKSPAFASDIGRYLVNDVKSALGAYDYPTRQIFVIGLPKSGSTWLHAMLLDLPGFNPRHYRSLSVKDVDGRFIPQYEYDNIDDSFFEKIPRRGHSVFKFHIRASERNIAILNHQTRKWIVTYRDIRDVCVSRYFHYKSDPNNHFYPLYQALSVPQALDHTIEIMRSELVPWIQGWREAARRLEGQICEVRYEDLWADTSKELERVLAFLGMRAPESFYRSAIGTRIAEAQDLRTNLQNTDRLLRRTSARQGGAGGWKMYFSEAQKEQLKKFAGELLIDLGYERDLNW